ncbi:MAG: hypothetical protein WBE76_14045 [Terracidiphilus sp.]
MPSHFVAFVVAIFTCRSLPSPERQRWDFLLAKTIYRQRRGFETGLHFGERQHQIKAQSNRVPATSIVASEHVRPFKSNNDGLTDIVQDTGQLSSAFGVSINNGNGTFKAPVTYMLPGKTLSPMCMLRPTSNKIDLAARQHKPDCLSRQWARRLEGAYPFCGRFALWLHSQK